MRVNTLQPSWCVHRVGVSGLLRYHKTFLQPHACGQHLPNHATTSGFVHSSTTSPCSHIALARRWQSGTPNSSSRGSHDDNTDAPDKDAFGELEFNTSSESQVFPRTSGGGGRNRATPITPSMNPASPTGSVDDNNGAVRDGGPAPTLTSSHNQLVVVKKKSMKMAEIRRTAEDRVRDSFRHTRDKLPKTDEEGLLLCFSQGTTDYCWRPIPHRAYIKEPRVLRSETAVNRLRLFGMPKGYPDTTAYGFQRFFYLSQACAFVSNFSSSIGYQSLLNGFFLGSSPQLWMLKDLVPALLAAYLANKVVSYENRPKYWFTISVFMNNISVISDMLIPKVFPSHLLAAAIITSTVKQSSALMFMVTRAAALQHFATHNNLAELTKKFNSFGMVNYTIATALGIVYCSYVPSFTIQLITAVVCCSINMVLSPMTMNPIAFRILNFTTIELIMHAYVKERKILTPEHVSDMLGTRMVVKLPEDSTDRHSLIYIAPPIDKLVIRSDTLEEDVLYVNQNGSFMIAIWEPSPVPLTVRECWMRWELPGALRLASRCKSFLRTFRTDKGTRKAEKVFGGKRLVLLVQTKCSPRDLITAYLILYTATMKHATTELELRSFIKQCHANQTVWQQEAFELRESLGRVNWDVNLTAIDHPDFRMSDLIVPPSMRPPRRSGGAPCNTSPVVPPVALHSSFPPGMVPTSAAAAADGVPRQEQMSAASGTVTVSTTDPTSIEEMYETGKKERGTAFNRLVRAAADVAIPPSPHVQ